MHCIEEFPATFRYWQNTHYIRFACPYQRWHSMVRFGSIDVHFNVNNHNFKRDPDCDILSGGHTLSFNLVLLRLLEPFWKSLVGIFRILSIGILLMHMWIQWNLEIRNRNQRKNSIDIWRIVKGNEQPFRVFFRKASV